MTSIRQGSIHLFRFAGVDLFLHWSWFLVAAFEISSRAKSYSTLTWNVLEYLALFLVVMLHEYGHALACRQVGGTANQIVLWPLGGVAYVNPPPRPGATLWSIVAGPLVNVAFLVILSLLGMLSRSLGWAETMPNVQAFMQALWFINLAHLSAGWRPDSSVVALVCGRARAQLDGGHRDRFRRRGGAHRPRRVEAIRLVWRSGRIHPDELLEGAAASAGAVAFGQAAPPRRVCLSVVQNRATGGKLLEVQPLWKALRYLPDASPLSELRGAVCGDDVSGLSRQVSFERVDCSGPRVSQLG